MRIISLSPSLTDILVALQAQDSLVGISDLCSLLPSSFPFAERGGQGKEVERVGAPKALQREKIRALAPDVILADSEDNRPDEIQKLQKDWKVQIFEVRTISEVCDSVARLGRLVQKENEAKRLTAVLRTELEASKKTFNGKKKKCTILLVWDQPYLTVNFDTYPSRLLEASGGVNAFREESIRQFPVEMEDMIKKNPELLLLAGDPALFQKRHIAQFRRHRILSGIPIHLVPAKFLNRYGPETVNALNYLRKLYFSLS